jgi:hypothetical protein
VTVLVCGALVATGISATVGWRPFIGPKTRPLTNRTFDVTPARLETIRTGRVRERQLSDLMPWAYYRTMTDEDLKAIFAYLKTVKPVEHYVDNTMAATACVLCEETHGGGERNKKG